MVSLVESSNEHALRVDIPVQALNLYFNGTLILVDELYSVFTQGSRSDSPRGVSGQPSRASIFLCAPGICWETGSP